MLTVYTNAVKKRHFLGMPSIFKWREVELSGAVSFF